MNFVDPKSQQMNKALMFRAHLLEHPLWRRPDHDNPSPATRSRRRLHHPISRTTRLAHRSSLDQSTKQRRSQCWPVCQTQTAKASPSPCDDFRASRFGRSSDIQDRQLSTCQPNCHGDLSAADLQSSCLVRQDRWFGTDINPCEQSANRSAATSPGTAIRYSGSNAPAASGYPNNQSTLARSPRTQASHRPCSGRSASTSMRSERSGSSAQFVYHGGGL